MDGFTVGRHATPLLQTPQPHGQKQRNIVSGNFWIGLSDILVDGEWLWMSTQTIATYTNWVPGEPNNYQSIAEDCAAMRTSHRFHWNDFACSTKLHFICEKECLKQKMEINRHIVSLQRYIRRYEQRVIRPLQFLSSKKTSFLQIHLKLHTNQVSMTDSFNKEDVAESLGAIKITERGNRRIGNDSLMKMLYCAELKQSFTLTGVGYCYHISRVNFDQVWISDGKNLILTNTSGALLHRVEDSRSGLFSERGFHTVNSENELIYIDRNDNINKLSNDMKTTTTFIVTTDSAWVPLCVYWSPSTGDVLVGMFNKSIGKVTRYNQSGQLTQTIQNDNTVQVLYRGPNFITENNNGDLVVSDFDCFNMTGAVVVTERGGRHRFSYTGPPTGGGLEPRGISTDALSHILVCDYKNNTVHIINKNGQFLSHLLREPQEMGILYSLSFDINTYRLWVGLIYNNKVYVYRYITRQYALKESNNGDIVVSDNSSIFWSGAEVVTERGGRHRFSYTGHPSKSGLRPHGICTDALSHILVCDCKTKTVQMIDRDGQFLSHLLTDSKEMGGLYGLSFDVNTHCLWVGYCNKVCGYRYIDRQDALTDKHIYSPDDDALSSQQP
uniref:Perlucin n=1 Tax=Magallana gigas TaxID=29159 RepID=K1QXL0_MAGGI